MTEEMNVLVQLSAAMTAAVARAAAWTVGVSARRRFPASGVAFAPYLVLTADHVIEWEEGIRVILPRGEEVEAALVGRDPGNDLALLRLPTGGLLPAERSPQATQVGQLVLALGHDPAARASTPVWASSAPLAGPRAPGVVVCWNVTCSPMLPHTLASRVAR